MEHLAEILKLIEGGIGRDPEKVASYAQLLASKLISDGEESAARRVTRALNSQSMTLRPADLAVVGAVPVDGESRVSIADVSRPTLSDVQVVLSAAQAAAVDDFILGYRHLEDLIAAGLRSPGHLLLYGPPGCGKTQTAAFVAAALELPLVTARLDGLVSSYLGSTAKNVRSLFEYVDRLPCVLFLDEFDAVAKMRDDPNELGELKRVVNSLLQNIDLLPSGTAVIAATNHPQLLDPAVWRRFETHLEISLPDLDVRRRLFRLYAPGITENESELLASLTTGRSAADIRSACDFVRRERVLRPDDSDGPLSTVRSLLVYLSRIRQQGEEQGTSIDDQIRFLRNASPKQFTYQTISDVLGVSLGKISKVVGRSRDESHG